MTSPHPSRPIPDDPAGWRHGARLGIRILATAAIVGATIGLPGLTGSTPALAVEAACGNGVAVVVDFTDLTVDGQSGTVEVGCADGDPENGRAALVAAGFTTTDSQPGFLCAISSRPDPCPETFDGSFWAYWHSTPDGEWTSYQVGADASDPAPGEIEGWRYNDGTTPPGIAPADVAAAAPTGSAPNGTGDEGSDQAGTGHEDTGQEGTGQSSDEAQAAQGLVLTVTAIGFLAIIVALTVVFAVRARRRAPGTSD